MLLLFFIALLAIVRADCSEGLFTTDPLPWGGAKCKQNLDCGGLSAGTCNFFPANSTTGTCLCPTSRAYPNCSYYRQNVNAPGGLSIGLAWISMGGIGSLQIGHTAVGGAQLGLALGGWVLWIVSAVLLCVLQSGSGGGCAIVLCIIGIVLGWALIISIWAWSIAEGAYILQCVYRDLNGYAMFR